ncbi:hypothetical protein TanjilG_19423 [Lupinus angustifolius]|uniref:Myb-like domain-containing protein n=1 Tax=Lupinus angustifolius TaxID=3871 RepID=A0A4P1R4P7_LUPAN|nr:PREDICTED: trihelix transcription factor PTL-like [Lupinus angustifolius]OIW01497.1 hypothetical protein TanjilG_19423 [Lupinus angustifolius]
MEDLRQLISPSTHVCCKPNFPEPLLSTHHCTKAVTASQSNSYDPTMVSHSFYSPGLTQFSHDYSSSTMIPTTNTTIAAITGSDHDATACFSLKETGWLGFDAGNKRWPRQETLSLIEIRSRMNSKFRETSHKGPLWNDISRIMMEEYGYERSGKKCKEKFENLYKYYKKTSKEGRHDGKRYRFFNHLQAIYGEIQTNTHARNIHIVHETPSSINNQTSDVFSNHKGSDQRLSLSKSSSEFETSSSENNEESISEIALIMEKEHKRQSNGRVRRKSLRVIVEEVVESCMRKIIEAQDSWMEKVLSVVEQREKEMMYKEDERKKKETMVFDKKVHELRAKERAWVEARDAALMEVVKKHSGREFEAELFIEEAQDYKNKREGNDSKEYPCQGSDYRRKWTEMEISNLIQLRFGFEHRFQENGYLENGQWDDIAEKMVCLGYNKSATECMQIWDEISISLSKA